MSALPKLATARDRAKLLTPAAKPLTFAAHETFTSSCGHYQVQHSPLPGGKAAWLAFWQSSPAADHRHCLGAYETRARAEYECTLDREAHEDEPDDIEW